MRIPLSARPPLPAFEANRVPLRLDHGAAEFTLDVGDVESEVKSDQPSHRSSSVSTLGPRGTRHAVSVASVGFDLSPSALKAGSTSLPQRAVTALSDLRYGLLPPPISAIDGHPRQAREPLTVRSTTLRRQLIGHSERLGKIVTGASADGSGSESVEEVEDERCPRA